MNWKNGFTMHAANILSSTDISQHHQRDCKRWHIPPTASKDITVNHFRQTISLKTSVNGGRWTTHNWVPNRTILPKLRRQHATSSQQPSGVCRWLPWLDYRPAAFGHPCLRFKSKALMIIMYWYQAAIWHDEYRVKRRQHPTKKGTASGDIKQAWHCKDLWRERTFSVSLPEKAKSKSKSIEEWPHGIQWNTRPWQKLMSLPPRPARIKDVDSMTRFGSTKGLQWRSVSMGD